MKRQPVDKIALQKAVETNDRPTALAILYTLAGVMASSSSVHPQDRDDLRQHIAIDLINRYDAKTYHASRGASAFSYFWRAALLAQWDWIHLQCVELTNYEHEKGEA